MPKVYLHCVGTLDFYIAPISSIAKVPAYRREGETEVTMSCLEERMHTLDSNLSLFRYVRLQPGDALYIPQGHVVAMKAHGMMVYGCRKSFIFHSTKSLENYQAAVEIQKTSGRDLANVSNVLAAIKKCSVLSNSGSAIGGMKRSASAASLTDQSPNPKANPPLSPSQPVSETASAAAVPSVPDVD